MKYFSPIGTQDFMWFIKYKDGTEITEFDYTTREKTSFNAVSKENIAEYGLVGIGTKMHVDVSRGTFHILDNAIDISYEVDGREIELTGEGKEVEVTKPYKQAQAVAYMTVNEMDRAYGDFVSNILSYEFGGAKEHKESGLKSVSTCHMVRGDKLHLQFKLTSHTDLDGFLIIKRNGEEVERYHAPIESRKWGALNWTFER